MGVLDYHDVSRFVDVGGESKIHNRGDAFPFQRGIEEFDELEGVSASAVEFCYGEVSFGCERHFVLFEFGVNNSIVLVIFIS